jgi:hypothetical protein
MVDVTVGSDTYTGNFANQATADLYLNASAQYAAPWAALTEDAKGRALISSTRRLERETWINGDVLPLTEPDVIDASIILAAQIAAKPAVATGSGTGSNIKVAGAGSARVEFFRGQDGAQFTEDVSALIAPFLAVTKITGESFGGSCDTITDDDRGHEGFA